MRNMHNLIKYLMVATSLCHAGVGLADQPLQSLIVPSEVFQPPVVSEPPNRQVSRKTSNSLEQARSTSRPISMDLGEPSEAELEQLNQTDDRRKVFQVGISREVPALPIVADWVWTPVTGGQVGQLIIVSEQATRMRALLRLSAQLPEGVEIRIYNHDNAEAVLGPFTQQNFQKSAIGSVAENTWQLWTPTLEGQNLGIEVFAPEGTQLDSIQLEIPMISHVVYDMKSGQLANISTQKLGSCDVSIACASTEWQETAKAVARYIYTHADGNSYLCSGTLITDQDTSTQIPYFLTAAHCIADSSAAASMDFFWLYRESSCGSNDAAWTQVSGGANLLVSKGELDTTLVRMNNLPPAGTTLSGWLLESFQSGEGASGIHHALGSPKQFSNGQFSSYVDIQSVDGGYTTTQNPAGDFTQVNWNWGITAPGSSGSGLWKTVSNQHLLTGTLVGGSSSCSAPNAPDEYSRIERFYPFATSWLGPPPPPPVLPLKSVLDNQSEPTALVDAIMVSRYMSGTRGAALLTGVTNETVDITTLEERLQAASARLDIDENGSIEPNKDGLLFIRYLLGLRGGSLLEGIDLSGSSNNTPSGISAFITTVLAGA